MLLRGVLPVKLTLAATCCTMYALYLLSSSSCLMICIRPMSKHTARQGQLGSTNPSLPSYLAKEYLTRYNAHRPCRVTEIRVYSRLETGLQSV